MLNRNWIKASGEWMWIEWFCLIASIPMPLSSTALLWLYLDCTTYFHSNFTVVPLKLNLHFAVMHSTHQMGTITGYHILTVPFFLVRVWGLGIRLWPTDIGATCHLWLGTHGNYDNKSYVFGAGFTHLCPLQLDHSQLGYKTCYLGNRLCSSPCNQLVVCKVVAC